MTARQILIVNADDFGQSRAVNRGVLRAHREGIVRSASLMVRFPAAAEAAAIARALHPGLSLGLHIDLGEWVFDHGEWVPLYEVVSPGDGDAVAEEVQRQLASFRALTSREPTHLDSHQHVHRRDPARAVVAEAARALSVPLRALTPGIAYCGRFYGQTEAGEPLPEVLSSAGLLQILRELPAGITELSCHPGEGEELGTMNTMYRSERAIEVAVLCDERVRAALPALGIELRSFADLPAPPPTIPIGEGPTCAS